MKFLMDNNVMTGTYTLMMLCGAELGRDAAIKKHEMLKDKRVGVVICGGNMNLTTIKNLL